MNGNQIKTLFLSFGDLDVEDTTIIGWIDMCQREISVEFPVEHTVTYTNVTANETKSIPDGVIELKSATYDDEDYDLSNIIVSDTGLTFTEALSSVTVVYTSPATEYTLLSNSLTVHPLFHSAVVLYLIAMYYDSESEGDNEESSLADKYWGKWEYQKNKILNTLMMGGSAPSTFDPIDTTDAMYSRSRGVRSLEEDDYYE